MKPPDGGVGTIRRTQTSNHDSRKCIDPQYPADDMKVPMCPYSVYPMYIILNRKTPSDNLITTTTLCGFTKLGRFHISSVVDLGPIAPLVIVGASAFHVLREVVKIVLKPIVLR